MRKGFKLVASAIITLAMIFGMGLYIQRHHENLVTSTTALADVGKSQLVTNITNLVVPEEHTNVATSVVVYDAGGVAKFQPHGSKAPVVPADPHFNQNN